MIKIILFVLLAIIVVAACVVPAIIFQSIKCKDCPLKEQSKQVPKKGEPLPCQNNIRHNSLINNQFSNGL